jgi:MFS family permease
MPTPDSARAWLMVVAAFIAGFVVFGITYCYGAFLPSITAEFHAGNASASAFFSVAGLVFYMLGPLTGHLSDRFGPRLVVGAGALIMGAGLILTAFIDRLWIGYLTYGAGVGIGAACAYVPTLATVGGWFVERRNAALGTAAAGTGCGMLLVPPLAALLIERFGWRGADIILGIGSGLLVMICAAIVAPAPLTRTAQAAQPLGSMVRTRAFLMMYASWVLATTALFVPLVFLPTFAVKQGIDHVAAAWLLALLGGVSVLGRLGIGTLADRVGTIRLFKIAVLVMAASYLLWLTLPGYGWLVTFVLVLGIGYGVRIALVPGVLIELFGVRNLGALLGVFFTASGVAAVAGPLLASFVVDATGSDQWGIVFALVIGFLGLAAILPLRAASTPRS